MTAGQGLTAGQRSGGPGLLSRQARSSLIQPVCQAMWMVSGHGSRLVRESTAKVPVELRLQWLQRLQLGRMQWYQVDLTTGLRQSYGRPTKLRLWYQVHTGTGLQQQLLGCRHLVCEWVWQQQPGRRLARPHRCIDMVHRLSGSYRLVPGLWWQQVQGHRQARLHRPGTQATWSRLSTSNDRQNYLVPSNKATQQRRPSMALPRMANIYVVPMLHSVGRVPTTADSYVVPKPCSVGRVPATAIMDDIIQFMP